MHGPLLTSDDDVDVEEDSIGDKDNRSSSQNGCMLWSIVVIAGIGGFLFGFDTGVISGVLLVLEADKFPNLTKLSEEWIVTTTLVGAAVGALLSGRAADRFGRRPSLAAGALLFLAGAIMMAVAADLPLLLVGRAVVGVGIGVASGIVPVYIAELAPARIRGRLVTVQNVMITTGQFCSYITDLAFLPVGTSSWRYMLGVSAIPAFFLLVGVVLVLPESPRWLLARGRRQKAQQALAKVIGRDAAAAECRRIEASLAAAAAPINEVKSASSPLVQQPADASQQQQRLQQQHRSTPPPTSVTAANTTSSPWASLWRDPVLRRSLVAGIGLQLFQQLCGINTAMYYSAVILQDAGFGGPSGGGDSTSPTPAPSANPIDAVVEPIALSCGVAAMNAVFTLVALGLMDRVGRRPLLLATLPGAAFGMALLAVGFSLQTTYPAASGALTFIGLIVFVAFFALGMGPVPWAVNAELYPTEVRSLAAGVATASNWIANILISSTFLSLETAVGRPATFSMFCVICLIAVLFVYKLVPETRGLTLEQIQKQLHKS